MTITTDRTRVTDLPPDPWAGEAPRWWRPVVAGYAVAVLLLCLRIKADVVGALGSSILLQAYGILVAVYLGTRMLLALAYRPVPLPTDDADLPVVAVVVPAFNEQEQVTATIDALFALDYPRDKLRVTVIDDGSTDGTWASIVAAAARHPELHALRFSANRGKRAGMAAGVRASSDVDVVLFVDSDSEIAPDGLRAIVAPFLAPGGESIGVVTGHADVLNASTNLLTRLQQVRYFAAFRVVKAAESLFGKVSCASGCFSAYRVEAVVDVMGEWESQTFLGREATFGDDRALTNYLIDRGWDSTYQSTAICGTAVPTRWTGFLHQQLRWKKSWARESLRVVRMAWRWHPAAAAAMYASILFQLAGPFVAIRTVLWVPVAQGGSPWLYLVGLHAMAVLYGLFYAWNRRSPHWWAGIGFAVAYAGVLCWQTYWAMIRSTDTSWGTRASTGESDGTMCIAAVVGTPQDCGLPLAADVERVAVTPAAAGETCVATGASPVVVGRRDWLVGTLAMPLSALPLVAWVLTG